LNLFTELKIIDININIKIIKFNIFNLCQI
jgi:hypothetical protein